TAGTGVPRAGAAPRGSGALAFAPFGPPPPRSREAVGAKPRPLAGPPTAVEKIEAPADTLPGLLHVAYRRGAGRDATLPDIYERTGAAQAGPQAETGAFRRPTPCRSSRQAGMNGRGVPALSAAPGTDRGHGGEGRKLWVKPFARRPSYVKPARTAGRARTTWRRSASAGAVKRAGRAAPR